MANGNNMNQRPNKPNHDDDENDLTVSRVLRNVLIWVGILVSLVMIAMMMMQKQGQEWDLTYNEYLECVNSNRIQYAVIKKSSLNDFSFHGVLKDEIIVQRDKNPVKVKAFRTMLGVVDANTEALWRQHNISFQYESADSPWWVSLISFLPWILLIGAFIFLSRRMQMGGGGSKNIFSFGKSKARMMSEGNLHVTFTDVAGADEAKEELREVIDFLREPSKFTRLGGKIPKGVLLLGPPGTGKTLLARAVAGEASVPFFSISGADFVEMFVGVGASRVRDLFEQAKRHAPCIVFIDEIDAVGRHRGAGLGGGHDEREQTLNQLLVEMDGFEQNLGIIIIAATNRPDVLDPALMRPGRFDRQVVVDRPDMNGRHGILKVHTRKVPMAKDVNLDVIAKGTPGFSGADLANLVNEAALLAARRNSLEVTMYDFESAKDKVMMGTERKSMIISDKEKETTAYHEIGHALAGKLLPESDPVHKVTIIPRGRALGVTSYLPNEDSHSMSKEYLTTRIVTLLAGRAAEKVVFNTLTTGASNDLERATNIARKMVCEWGMSEKLGPVHYAGKADEVFLGRDISQPSDHSEETSRAIDMEIRHLIVDAEHRAEQIMRENLDMLHKLSKALVEREILDGAELDVLMNGGELAPIVKNIDHIRATLAKEKEQGSKASSPAPMMPPDATPGISPA